MRQTVLCYNIKGTDKEKKLTRIFSILGCRLRHVDRGELLYPIGVLAGLDEAKDEFPVYRGDGFPEEMLVMALKDSAALNQAVQMMRREKAVVGLKAVLTQSNREWPFLSLYEELRKEHEFMNR